MTNKQRKLISQLDENHLKQLIQQSVGSDADKRVYINEWINKHYGKNKSRLADSIDAIVSSIGINGIDGNSTLEFVDNFLKKTNQNLISDYVTLLSGLMDDKVISPQADWLYEPWLYNESIDENVIKIKAIAFILDSKNVKRYGLKNEQGTSLSLKDLEGKSAKEMLDILDNAQTKGTSDYYDLYSDDLTIGDWLNNKGYSEIDIYKVFYPFIQKIVKDAKKLERYEKYLRELLNNSKFLNYFMKRSIKSNSEEDVITAVLSFLESFDTVVEEKVKDKDSDKILQTVLDAMETLHLPRAETIRYFNDVYKPGMSAEEVIQLILKTHGKNI